MKRSRTSTNVDIWERIATFLSADTLISLLKVDDVNSVLYDHGMRARYNTITFSKSDKETKKLCAELQVKDGVCDLVRQIDIHPWLVQPRTNSAGSFTENIWNRLCKLYDPDYSKKRAEERVQKRLKKDISRITDTVSGLKNLENYRILWDGHRVYHPELYKAFLTPLLGKLKSNLTKLAIGVPLEMLCNLGHVSLPCLKELELQLVTGSTGTREINNILDGVLVFVHNLKDSLSCLSVSSTASSEFLDLSRFFTYLGKFSGLKKLALSIPFDGAQLPSTDSFECFLDIHRDSLEDLTLGTSRCSAPIGPHDPKKAECKNWIQHIVASAIDKPFPELRRLELALRPLKADLRPLIDFLHTHKNTLDFISLTDRVLTLEEVQSLLDALVSRSNGHLRQLRLRVLYLSPELLYLLAARFPRLELAALSASEVRASESGERRSGVANKEEEIRRFCSQMYKSREDYSNWMLRKLALPEEHLNLLPAFERVLMECIPALENILELTTITTPRSPGLHFLEIPIITL